MASRQREVLLFIVVDDVKPGEPSPDGLAGVAHPMVVIPQRRRALLHGKDVFALSDNGVAWHARVHAAVAGDGVGGMRLDEVERVAVTVGRGVTAVQVHRNGNR